MPQVAMTRRGRSTASGTQTPADMVVEKAAGTSSTGGT